MKPSTVALLFLLMPFWGKAQIGGESAFEFLSLSPAARTTAMGGSYISYTDYRDLSLAFMNPSGLNPMQDKQLSVGTVIYPGRINYGNLLFAWQQKKLATFSAGLQYISYGKIPETDAAGNVYGTFNPSEYAFQLGAGKQYQKYSFGANAKFIVSDLGGYTSTGMAADLAASYVDTAKNVSATLLLRNMGYQFNPYIKGDKLSSLPFDVQLGVSYRFKFIPLRLSLLGHNLFRWDIRYEDPNLVETSQFIEDSTAKQKKYTFDKIARHFIFGAELYITKYINVNFAYNHLRRAELAYDFKKGLSGFSFGLGVHIKMVDFNYGVALYSKGFSSNHFTLMLRLNDFKDRNKGAVASY